MLRELDDIEAQFGGGSSGVLSYNEGSLGDMSLDELKQRVQQMTSLIEERENPDRRRAEALGKLEKAGADVSKLDGFSLEQLETIAEMVQAPKGTPAAVAQGPMAQMDPFGIEPSRASTVGNDLEGVRPGQEPDVKIPGAQTEAQEDLFLPPSKSTIGSLTGVRPGQEAS